MKAKWFIISSNGEKITSLIADEADLDDFCKKYDVDFERLLDLVEVLPAAANKVKMDIDYMHANNFGRYTNMTEARHLDIQYVTEKPVQVQAVKVTRENIYHVAEWVGANMLTTPIRKYARLGKRAEPWFILPDSPRGHINGEVTVGHWVVRDKRGDFSRMSEVEFKKRYDFPEETEKASDAVKMELCKVPLNSHVPMANTCVLVKDHDGAHRTWGLGWNLITFESPNRVAWNSGL